MDAPSRWCRATVALLGVGSASGCSAGAPSLSLFGAYFPAWLVCLLFGVLTALVTRILLITTGLAGAIPLQLLVCVCAGITAGVLLSFLWLGV